MMEVNITVESIINATEDEAKVERALHSIFPSTQVQRIEKQNELFFRIHARDLESLSTLRNLIRQERIRSAARSILRGGTRGQRVQIYLNKQVAFTGRVSFCEPTGESPNGPISVEIESSEPETVIDFLASAPDQGYMLTGRRGR